MNCKKSILIGALALCCALSSAVGVTAMAETISLPAPQSRNVLRDLSTDAFSVKDYKGNPITEFVGQNGAGREYGLGLLHNGDNTSWDVIAPTVSGARALAWFYVDLGQTYTVDKVMISMNHDWSGQDVVVQLATNESFSNAITIYNNDVDNSLGCGETFTADQSIEVSANLGNFGTAGESTDDNGNIFTFTPVKARYMRVTNNQYGNGSLTNYTAITELELYAYDVVETPTSTAEVLPVAFSRVGGLYPDGVQVELSSDHTGAEIYYTLDGSIPNVNGDNCLVYQNPLYYEAINGEVKIITIKAITVYRGMASEVATYNYVVNTNAEIVVNNDVIHTYNFDETAYLILAEYDDEILLDVEYFEVTNNSSIALSESTLNFNNRVVAYLVRNLTRFNPLCDALCLTDSQTQRENIPTLPFLKTWIPLSKLQRNGGVAKARYALPFLQRAMVGTRSRQRI